MLDLRGPLRTLLGNSFNVLHSGPNGVVTVAVNVGDYGTGEGLPLPCVLFLGQDRTTMAADIGGHGVENRNSVAMHILTMQAGDGSIDPVGLLTDIEKAVESSIRASQNAVGNSYFTLASASRDFKPVQQMAGPFWWTRWLEVRGTSLEHY